MGPALLRGLIGLTLALVLAVGAVMLWLRSRRLSALIQLVGAAAILLVVLVHLAEAAHVLSFMGWGRPDSPGHYLDLASACLGATLFPGGYLAQALTTRRG